MSSFLDFEGEVVALQTLPEGLRVAGGSDQDVRPAVLRGHVDLCGEAGSVEFGADHPADGILEQGRFEDLADGGEGQCVEDPDRFRPGGRFGYVAGSPLT